jgi:hypothetical protein
MHSAAKTACLVLRLRRHAPRANQHSRKSPTTGLGFVVFVDLPTDTSNQSCIDSAGTFTPFFFCLFFVRVHSGRSTLLIFEIITGRTDYFFAISIGLATAGLFHSSKTRSMLGRIKNYCFLAFLRSRVLDSPPMTFKLGMVGGWWEGGSPHPPPPSPDTPRVAFYTKSSSFALACDRVGWGGQTSFRVFTLMFLTIHSSMYI